MKDRFTDSSVAKATPPLTQEEETLYNLIQNTIETPLKIGKSILSGVTYSTKDYPKLIEQSVLAENRISEVEGDVEIVGCAPIILRNGQRHRA